MLFYAARAWSLSRAVVGLAGTLLLAGCGSGETVGMGPEPPPGPPPNGGSPGGAALSLDRDLQPIFSQRCASIGCHAGSAPAAEQDLSAGNAFASLVDVESTGVPGLKRVEPGDPDASFLIEKLVEERPRFGNRMPFNSTPLPQDQIDLIREWIRQGAAP